MAAIHVRKMKMRSCAAVALLLILFAACEVRKISDLGDVQAALENATSNLGKQDARVLSEFFYGDENDWAIVIVPDKPSERSDDAHSLAPVAAELLRFAAKAGTGQLMLANVKEQSPEIRVLSRDKTRVNKMFVVTGKGQRTIVARIAPDSAGRPILESFEVSQQRP